MSKFENKVWIILLVVLSFVFLSGYFVYQSLSGIVNDLTEEARPDETVLLMKDVLYDLTEAENNVKSYTLTAELNYLNDFNQNFTDAEDKINQLRKLTEEDVVSKAHVDTLDLLIGEKFIILENLLLLQDRSRVTSALDRVSTELETSATEEKSGIFDGGTAPVKEEKVIEEAEEEKFFQKLLNKRKKNEEVVAEKTTEPVVEEKVLEEKITLEEINKEILAVKKEEEKIDRSVREKELFLIQEDKKVMDKILAIYSDMEANETLNMEEKLALADENSKETKIVIGVFCLLACALLIFAGFAVNTYVKRNELFKIALRKAKQETDAKNKEITDSITYAQKIQEAILPDRKLIEAHLKDSFILYKPKDIVAGDFYWTVKTEKHLFLAVADCTGHGVPGAMVSVVCSTALNRCVREFGLTQPAQILDKCRDLVIETFASGTLSVNDGMDIALIALSYTKDNGQDVAVIEYAGANNSIYLVKNGNLQDIHPDKQPIGKYQHATAFNNQKLIAEKGSMIYLFSDGYADQFGGPYGKKLKYKNFQELLIKNSTLTPSRQLEVLESSFESWQGNLEQVDDVCVIGVRV